MKSSGKDISPKINWKQFFLFMLLNFLLIAGVIVLTFKRPAIVKLNKVEFNNSADSFLNFNINLKVKNPNFFSISGKDIEINLAESELIYGKGDMQPFFLRGNGENDIAISMKVNFKQFIKSYNKTDTLIPSVSISGSFMPGFFLNRINLERKIPKRQLFTLLTSAFRGGNLVKADSFSISKASALESQINFSLRLVNKFNFEFSIEEVKASVYASDKMNLLLGNVSLRKSILLPPNENASIPLQVMADNLSILRALFGSGFNELRSLFISGEAVVNIMGEQIVVPFDLPMEKPANPADE